MVSPIAFSVLNISSSLKAHMGIPRAVNPQGKSAVVF